MDPPAGGLAHLESYGALGIVAAALLALVVLLVKRFVDHAIDSNTKLQTQNSEMQKENLKAIHAMVLEMKALRNEMVHEFRTGIASIINDQQQAPPRERRATRPPYVPPGRSGSG